MISFFKELFSTEGFMRRWACGQWTPVHGWMYILSNVAIGLAYMITPLILLYFIKKKKYKVPFEGIIFLFIAFIFMCGTTHISARRSSKIIMVISGLLVTKEKGPPFISV